MADRFWKIEEAVGGGLFITHPGTFTTREAAGQEADKYPNARAALYQTGGWRDGPIRVPEEEWPDSAPSSDDTFEMSP